MTGLFSIDFTNVKGALYSATIAALVGILLYIAKTGDVFALDYHILINAGVMSAVTALIASLTKKFVTNSKGVATGIQVE